MQNQVLFQSKFSSFGESLFSGGFGRFFFFAHFGSGFQIVGLVKFSRSFQFSFSPLVKVLVYCGF